MPDEKQTEMRLVMPEPSPEIAGHTIDDILGGASGKES
jgi:hypothetical protein